VPDQLTITSTKPQLIAPPVHSKVTVRHIGGADLTHGDKTLREGSSVTVRTPGEEFSALGGSATCSAR
jgi:hypothetical protein